MAQSTKVRCWRSLAVVTLAAIAALTALPADAVAQKARPAPPPKEATAPRDAGEPIMAIVSIKSQQVTLYDADGWILRAPVSTGTKERETPAGVFAVVEKKEDHRSNMYDDAHMPHMQRITWNGIALHGGPLPGYAASHGCVRMPFGFAEKLFDKTRIGMRVIIAPNDAAPVEFSHPALLVPNAEALAAAPARAEPLVREAMEAARAADEAKKAVAAAARDAALLTVSLRKLEQLKARADAELARAERALAAAKTEDVRAKAEEAKQKAAAKASEAATQLDAARADAKSKPDPAAAKEAAKAAETKKAATARAALEAKLALEPVSIYISRATQKLYVRRNTHKPAPDGGGEVFDSSIEVPIAIRDPFKPIGTHVFTAVASDRAGLRWIAVTIRDHHLGRAAERGNQLPHRVRRGAEQPAAGRLHHARAYDRCCGGRPIRRRRLLVFPARLGLSKRPSGLGASTWSAARSNWRPAQRGLSDWSSARLGTPTWQFRLARRRPVFSAGATTLVIGAGAPRDEAGLSSSHSGRAQRGPESITTILATPEPAVVMDSGLATSSQSCAVGVDLSRGHRASPPEDERPPRSRGQVGYWPRAVRSGRQRDTDRGCRLARTRADCHHPVYAALAHSAADCSRLAVGGPDVVIQKCRSQHFHGSVYDRSAIEGRRGPSRT